MRYCLCSRSSFNDVVYTPKATIFDAAKNISFNHNMYEVIQTNFMATFYTVAIISVCFEMFETDEQRKMDNTRISLGTF